MTLTGSMRAILQFPDSRLRKKAAAVNAFDGTLQQVIADMLETMHASQGIGLAATQINVHQRIVVIDIPCGHSMPLCLINPVITEMSGTSVAEEGCLSLPNVFATLKRAQQIKIRAQRPDGGKIEFSAAGLLASCIQHEVDHLNGRLLIDHLSYLKRQRVFKQLRSGCDGGAPI